MGAPALSRLLTPIQRQPGIIPAIPGAFPVVMRARITHPRASPRRRGFATERTLARVPDLRSIARPFLTQEFTLLQIHNSPPLAEPLFALKVLTVRDVSWRDPV